MLSPGQEARTTLIPARICTMSFPPSTLPLAQNPILLATSRCTHTACSNTRFPQGASELCPSVTALCTALVIYLFTLAEKNTFRYTHHSNPCLFCRLHFPHMQCTFRCFIFQYQGSKRDAVQLKVGQLKQGPLWRINNSSS